MIKPLSAPRRVPLGECVLCVLLALNLVWSTLCLGAFRPEFRMVSLALTAAAVVWHLAVQSAAHRRWLGVHPAALGLLPFIVYAALNVALVTPVAWLGWLDWLGWLNLVAFFWLVLDGITAPQTRQALFITLAVLGVTGVVLGSYQQFVRPDWAMFGQPRPASFIGRASGSFAIPNSFAGFLLLILPAIGALALRRWATEIQRVWWGWVAVVLIFGLALTLSRGAWVSLVLAVIVWPLMASRARWLRRAGLSMLVCGLVAIAAFLVYTKSDAVRARLQQMVLDRGEITRPVMWRGAWNLFREQPWFGTGAGSYNVVFERVRPAGFRDEPLWAHNEFLNVLSDFGAVGFGLLFGAVAVIAWRCRTRPAKRGWAAGSFDESSLFVSGLGVGLLAFGLQMAVDFHLRIPALALACATVAGLLVARRWPKPSVDDGAVRSIPSPWSRWPAIFGGAGAGVGLVFGVLPMLRSEALRLEGRHTIEQMGALASDDPGLASMAHEAARKLRLATEVDPRNPQAWADRAYAASLVSRHVTGATETLGKEAEMAASRALSLAPICAESWTRRGVARDLLGRWAEAGADFQQAVRLAPNDSVAWYYLADHLSRGHAVAREPAEAALAFCLRLDPENGPAVALRHRLASARKAH